MRSAKRGVVPTLLVIVTVAALVTLVCRCDRTPRSNGCVDNSSCPPDQPVCCSDGFCHECCIADDCLDHPDVAGCPDARTSCNGNFECECVCIDADGDCSAYPGDCCDGFACDVFTNTCTTECASDADCAARTEIPFHDDLVCDKGVCDFDGCHKDADCPGGKVCFNGYCVTLPDCSELRDCVVLPENAVTRQNTTARFSATAYLHSGSVAPGMTFTWSSSDPGVASVDDHGLITGGANTGGVTITATATSCSTITCTSEVFNYTAPINTRVVVLDDLTNAPVQGATVMVGIQAPQTTDQHGVAVFSVILDASNPADITVSKEDYHYTTLRNVERADVVVHVGKIHHLDFSTRPPTYVAGGIQGKFNFDQIRCEPDQQSCSVFLGLAGLSIPGNLLAFDFLSLGDCTIMAEIELGGQHDEVPLPIGMVLCLNKTCFKDRYCAMGAPGKRAAWGFGGKLNLADLIERIGPIIGTGEDVDIGLLMGGLLPLYSNLYTDMVPNVDVAPIPMVEGGSSYECFPGTDLLPDCTSFPWLDLTPSVKMDQVMTFDAPTLPLGTYDSVVLIGGVIVRGAGFVPLGLSGGSDSRSVDDPPNGVIEDPIVLTVAEVAGRVPEDQVKRVIVAQALRLSDQKDESSPKYSATQVLLVDAFSGHHTLGPFMLPAEATYDPANRLLKVTSLPEGADYSQVTFLGKHRTGWNILGEWETGTYDLPAALPSGDRADTASFVSVDLADGNTYQDLLEFNDSNLGNVVDLAKAFSITEVP